MDWVAIGICGVVGVLARYGLMLLVPVGALSWSVLLANILGSFAAGWIYAWKVVPSGNSSTFAAAMLVGLLGGFTTFSSFALDTVRLLHDSQWSLAITNVLVNNLLAISACFFGIRLGSWQ